MRVWSKYPKLISGISNKPLYGWQLGFPPTSIEYSEFIINKNNLVEAPYTTEFLRKIFPDKQIPDNIRFTLLELRFMSYNYIRTIATILGINEKLKKKGLIFKIRELLKDI